MVDKAQCYLIYTQRLDGTVAQGVQNGILDLILNQITQYGVSVWFYFIGCSVSLFIDTSLLIIFFYKNELKKSPGDIFMANFVLEIIMAIQWLISASYSYEDSPLSYSSFQCQFTAALTLLSHLGQYFYILAFFYFITRQVKTSFSSKGHIQWLTHLVVIILTLIICVIVFSMNLTGKNVDGKCSLVISLLADYLITLGYTITLILYCSIGGYSLYYIKKNIPNQYKVKASKYIKLNVIYFITYLILTLLSELLELLASLSCTYFWQMHLNAMYSIAALLDIMMLISMPIIRINDPYTKRVLMIMFGLKSDQKKKETIELVIQSQDTLTEQDSIRPKSQTDDNPFVNVLQNKKRSQIMSKMIAGLQIDQYSKEHTIDIEIINYKSTNIYEEKKVYKFINDQLVTSLPYNPCSEFVEIIEENPQLKVVSYTPIIFHVIMNRDKQKINIFQSLNINDNFEKIKNASKNDGGKSGQFFFYSQDNQLIIKTVTQQELKIILIMLQNYFQYLLKNPDSLIAKIYGLYSFELEEDQETVHIIVMRNIAATANTHRIYDLKGSTFDREVAKRDTDLQRVVLKDLDFLNMEKYLYISSKDGQFIVENAIKDANFFRSQGLIDYSLIVFKIVNEQDHIPEFKQNVFYCEDQRYRYHIGIIDYLQEYNVQKSLEKYSKKLIKLNPNIDTSSQDPKVYAERFSLFIRQIAKVD